VRVGCGCVAVVCGCVVAVGVVVWSCIRVSVDVCVGGGVIVRAVCVAGVNYVGVCYVVYDIVNIVVLLRVLCTVAVGDVAVVGFTV